MNICLLRYVTISIFVPTAFSLLFCRCGYGAFLKNRLSLSATSTSRPNAVIASVLTAASLACLSPQDVFAVIEPVSPTAVAESGTRKSVQLPSGVQYFDFTVGTGDDIVREGSSVQFQWVLRRSNGYFVDKSTEPFIYRVGNTKKVMKGLDEAIRGMKIDGIRRINIPAQLAFVEGVEDGKPGPIPEGYGPKRQILSRLGTETWYIEVKLVKLKN